MPRSALPALAAAVAALALTGCGAGPDRVAPDLGLPAAGPTGTGAAVEVTDGRLGDATTVRPGGPLRELSPGGKLDARPRGQGGRRDGVGAGDACPNPALVPAADNLAAVADATLCLLNGQRADHGLPPLALNAKLTDASARYAADLVAGSYFSHTGRDGSTVTSRLTAAGYITPDGGWHIGENLAWGTGALATPGSIVQAWMNSEGHRDNILNADYREIGVGIVVGNPMSLNGAGATYATDFGTVDQIEGQPAAGQPDPAPAAKPAKDRPARKATKRKRRHRAKAHKAARAARHAKGKGKSARARAKAKRHGKAARGPLARIAI
jgi:uncharacterized protein YkwD